METLARWTIYEGRLESTTLAASRDVDPFWDVDVRVRFTGPSGQATVIEAFWDGGNTWRFRFAPDEVGVWTWETSSNLTEDEGLNAPTSRFQCGSYEGDNPLYNHGPVRLSENRRYLVWGDGAPFFWLADTAWNGVLRADEADWARYLETRRDQDFTVVQFVSTQWRGGRDVLGDKRAFEGTDHIRLNPAFFRALDDKVAAINAHGLVAAPVALWALTESDPGQALTEVDAVRLVKYLVARWGAHHVAWFLGGDGRYQDEAVAARWRRIGNAVFNDPQVDRHRRLVTMHPCGQSWVGPLFRGEAWFDFIGYQSGHGSSESHLRWLAFGPPATEWDNDPALPVINLEPNYEMHPSYHEDQRFTDREVRRAAYWSLLVSPTAGVTYGNNPIWVWPETTEVPENHENIGPVDSWEAGLETSGIRSMMHMRQFFASLSWWRLRPAPDLVADQPGEDGPERFIAAAKSVEGGVAVVYVSEGGSVTLNAEALGSLSVGCWFNPRTGTWLDTCVLPENGAALDTPDGGDWVLCIRH